MEFSSTRERIVELLTKSDEPLTIDEIADSLGLDRSKRSEIYEHLTHIAKSVKQKGLILVMVPPKCKSCGYVFKDLTKPRKPSKCPRCRSERIYPPRFKILPRS